jgi:hypothetical protein
LTAVPDGQTIACVWEQRKMGRRGMGDRLSAMTVHKSLEDV